MASRRTLAKTFAFDCDDCGTSLDTERFDWARALMVMKAAGWRVVRDITTPSNFRHSCADCAPERR
jgi:hypothetical protein